MKRLFKLLGQTAVLLILGLTFGAAAHGATLTVTKTADTNDGACDADCSLREAIAAANATNASDSITFAIPPTDAGCVNAVCTVRLGGTQLTINNASTAGALTISNPNGTAENLLVSGNNASRVFNVGSGANLSLNNLTVTGGRLSGNNNLGGGIFNLGGTVTLTNCAVSNNALSGGSGGSSSSGGGIFVMGGTLNMTNSAVSNNSITGTINDGAGIYAFQSTLNITGSSIANNSASGDSNENYGGGIYMRVQSIVRISNSTISGNSVTGSGNNQGGGIFVQDTSGFTLDLTNSTVSNNSAIGGSNSFGGGIRANNFVVNVRNTIISGNTAASSADYNAGFNVNDSSLIGGNAGLAPLGNYGGAMMTHALLSGSAAVNTGNNCVLTQSCAGFNAPVALTTDQRGASRVGQVDIGAFELNNLNNGGNFVAQLPNGTENFAYNFTIAPNNSFNSTTFTYTVSSGSLPNGINLTTNFAPDAVVALTGTPLQSGTFNFAITASDGTNTNVTNYSLQIFGPTAAGVSISGRVFAGKGRGLLNAIVTLTDAEGNLRSARTNQFGYYRFDGVAVGQTMVISVVSKRFQFAPQIITLNDNIANLDFVASSQ